MSDVLIVGNGPAAHRLVTRLRHRGHQGTVTVLGAEARPAYNRSLLTSVLDRTLAPDALALPPYPEGVRVRLGTTATGIDRARRLVRTDDGTAHRYDRLVLACGARPRLPGVLGLRTADGGPAEGVRTLRTPEDHDGVPRGQVVVLGAGVLGVETAFALRRAGHDVRLVHRGPYPLDRLVDATAGRLVADFLTARGVPVELGRRAVEYAAGKLVLDDGRVLTADTLLVCAGVVPETGLARAAGLTVRTGVLVDEALRTDDPRIHAVGDCAEQPGRPPGRLDSAWEQAETLAEVLTGGPVRQRPGRARTRLRTPGLDVAALGRSAVAEGAGEVVTLSDPARGRYARLELRDERLVGAVLVGLPAAIAALSRLHDQGAPVPSDRLALLLGRPPVTSAGPVELPDDAIVCHCAHVTGKTLVDAWRAGARGRSALAAATRATTGCGGCADAVQGICAALGAPAGGASAPGGGTRS